jgi:hypothetical protein
MSSKLNEEYFKTKRKHKEGLKKNHLTLKKVIFNLIITLIILFLYNIFSNHLSKKAEQNKKEGTSNLYYQPYNKLS